MSSIAKKKSSAHCSGGGIKAVRVKKAACRGTDGRKNVLIEYLYLDLDTCDRCIGTGAVLGEAVAALTPALTLAGYRIDYKQIEMSSAEVAMQYHFLSSPTIRVNGRDICRSVTESHCACCGEISGTAVDCRIFEYEGKRYEVPPKAMLADAILKAVFGAKAGCSCGDYKLPNNLKRFFAGKAAKAGPCSCGGDCK